MAIRAKLATAVLLIVAPIAFLPGSASASARHCKPPHGPGDNLVHSHALRAHRTHCRAARRVVLAQPGPGSARVNGLLWHCDYLSPFPNAKELCAAGNHRWVTIKWLD